MFFSVSLYSFQKLDGRPWPWPPPLFALFGASEAQQRSTLNVLKFKITRDTLRYSNVQHILELKLNTLVSVYVLVENVKSGSKKN